MPTKSELFSVRISPELKERIDEIVREQRENPPEYGDEPTEPEVHREIIEHGVEVHEEGESDLHQLRREIEQLEEENQELGAKIEEPTTGDWVSVSARAPVWIQTALTGVFLSLVLLVGWSLSFLLESEIGVQLPSWLFANGIAFGVSIVLIGSPVLYIIDALFHGIQNLRE